MPSPRTSSDGATKCDLSPPERETEGRDATPKPHVWREVIAHWTIPMRQEWGELANAKIDEGMSWQEAERSAFETIGDRYTYDPDSRTYLSV